MTTTTPMVTTVADGAVTVLCRDAAAPAWIDAAARPGVDRRRTRAVAVTYHGTRLPVAALATALVPVAVLFEGEPSVRAWSPPV